MHFKESVTACAKDICAIERLVEGRRGIKWWNEEIAVREVILCERVRKRELFAETVE